MSMTFVPSIWIWLGIAACVVQSAYLREREVPSLILSSARSGGDIGRLEAIGARNFLDLDDIAVTEEGEPIDAQSIIRMLPAPTSWAACCGIS